MNTITILGRVGRDPELRTTAGGTQVLSFPVADSKKVKGEDKTTWYDCSLFGSRATSLQPYIQKGNQICVTGEHELQTWQKDDGTTGFKCSVKVNNVGFVSSGMNQGAQPTQPASQPAQGFQQPQQGFNNPPPAPVQPSPDDDFSQSIPF